MVFGELYFLKNLRTRRKNAPYPSVNPESARNYSRLTGYAYTGIVSALFIGYLLAQRLKQKSAEDKMKQNTGSEERSKEVSS